MSSYKPSREESWPGSEAAAAQTSNSTPNEVVTIDEMSDLKLNVVREDHDKVCFLVCSKALARSAQYWKVLLYGNFKEAKPKTGEEWVVQVEEDDTDAFHVLLLLIHGQMHKIPDVDLKLVFEVTVLTDKYQMNHCLRAVARTWLEDLRAYRATTFDAMAVDAVSPLAVGRAAAGRFGPVSPQPAEDRPSLASKRFSP